MSDVPQSAIHAETDTHGAHRTRATYGGNWKSVFVYLTDGKQIDPPTKAPLTPTEPTAADTLRTMALELKAQNPLPLPHTPPQRDERIPSPDELRGIEKTATAGATVVLVPQLFPTLPELAGRMVELAEIHDTHRVLEPSAGTGNILRAIGNGPDKVAVEVNADCVRQLASCGLSGLRVHHADFLGCNGDLGTFDRILMNPPFANTADIGHIRHALTLLRPGGRLVAICANGPRQNDQLRPLVDKLGGSWECLPPDTFNTSGTSVNTALLVLHA